MECYSSYKSHEEEITKIANEVQKNRFDSETEITIKEEWNKDKNFEQTQPFPSENKQNENESDKGLAIWSDFDNEQYKPYKCTKCNEAFEFNKDLLIHIEVTHENNLPFECSKCNHSFYEEVELIFHTCNKKLVSSVYQCFVCYISFGSARAMIAHSRVHNTQCPMCYISFGNARAMMAHSRVCNISFGSARAVIDHSRVHKIDKKKDNNPQNDIAIVYDKKIPKKHKIKKPPTKKIRLADEDLEEVHCLTKDTHDIHEIEIQPTNNKKEQKIQKPITKPKNTDITFSEDILCLTKDDQSIDEIEILPKTSKKNKIVPTSKKGNGFSKNKAENQHRLSKPTKFWCNLCKVDFKQKWDLELHVDFFHPNQCCKKSENRDDYNKVSENILSQNGKFKSNQSSTNYWYERLREEKESYKCLMCREKFAKEFQLSQHTCKAYFPFNNKKDYVQKLTIKKPKPRNTDSIIFSDEEIEELPRTKDNQNIDGIEVLPKNDKKNKIFPKPIAEQRLHEDKKSYECMMCCEKFAKESQLSQHTCKAYIPQFSKPDPPEFRKLNAPEFEQIPSTHEQTVEMSFDDIDEDISFQQPELTITEDFFELNPCN